MYFFFEVRYKDKSTFFLSACERHITNVTNFENICMDHTFLNSSFNKLVVWWFVKTNKLRFIVFENGEMATTDTRIRIRLYYLVNDYIDYERKAQTTRLSLLNTYIQRTGVHLNERKNGLNFVLTYWKKELAKQWFLPWYVKNI